ncbi:hypothetical protein D3C80_1505180 [compost metagenome]
MHRHVPIPVFQGRRLDVPRIGDAGALHQDIQRTPVLFQIRQCGAPVGVVTHVQLGESRVGAELIGQGLAGGTVDVGQQHLGAFRDEQPGDPGADTRCGAGHQRHLAFDTLHVHLGSKLAQRYSAVRYLTNVWCSWRIRTSW